MQSDSIPIISLEAPETTVVTQIKHANETIGFFAIIDHGIPKQLIRDLWEECFQFWQRVPQSLLVANVTASTFIWLDYTPTVSNSNEATKVSSSINSKTTSSSNNSNWIVGPTEGRRGMPWAPDSPRMRQLWHEYYQAMEALLHRLMRVFALSLGLEQDYFEDKLDQHCSPMRTVFYPPLSCVNLDDKGIDENGGLSSKKTVERAGEHTDWGCVTFLLPDPFTGGLEIKLANGVWISAPVLPAFEAFIINLGDLMPRWTQDKWKATPHRVIASSETEQNRGRMTIPFFGLVNGSTLLEAIPSCCEQDEGQSVTYEPILAGQFFSEHEKFSVYHQK